MSVENLPNTVKLQEALFAGLVYDPERKATAHYRKMAHLLASGLREEALAEKREADILWDKARGREGIIRNFIYDISDQAGISDEALASIAESLATTAVEQPTTEISPEKYRPTIVVNENERTWLVNNRLVEWKAGAAGDVAFAIAKYCKDGNPIDNSEVARLARLAGIKGSRPSAHTINSIREGIGDNSRNPAILITLGRKQKASYLLDADITFVSQDIPPTVIEVDKKPKTEGEETIELLGEELWNKLGEVQKRMLIAVGKSKEEAMTAAEWEERTYNDVDIRSDKNPPGNRISGNLPFLQNKLINGGWIIDHVEEIRKERSPIYYYFLNRKPEDVIEAQPTAEDKTEKTLPTLKINLEDWQIEIDGKIKHVTKPHQQSVLKRLANTPQQDVPSQELEELAKSAGFKRDFPAGTTIQQLRQLLKLDGIITRYGSKQSTRYRLNAEVESIEKRPEGVLNKEMTLPDGQTITLYGTETLTLFEWIMEVGSESEPIKREDLLSEIFGEDINSGKLTFTQAEEKLMSIIDLLNTQLKGARFEILEKDSGYYIAKAIVPEDQMVEDLINPDEIREIPYAPSEKDKRSENENLVLDKVLKLFLVRNQLTPELFSDLQRALRSVDLENRVREYNGKPQFRVMSSNEIFRKFEESLRKIREEAESDFLRFNWAESDQELWENARQLIGRISGGDIEVFKNHVRQQLTHAERGFYKKYRPQNGDKMIVWMDI